jgi:hypothetical protein
MAYVITLYNLQKLLNVEITIEGDYKWWLGFGCERKRNYQNDPQDATIQVNLLFLVNSTCFGQCFRPSSGTPDCIYSIW